MDTDPATAFDPFLNISSHNTKAARAQAYVNLQNTGEYELPIYYATFNGDLFNLPAGPVSFAIGGEYDAPRFSRDRDALNTTFNTIGSVDGQSFRVNRDIWGVYEEVRVPFTSPTWNFPGFYSFEVDFAEREEWYSNNTSAVLPSGLFAATPAVHTRYNAQKPKVSVRWGTSNPLEQAGADHSLMKCQADVARQKTDEKISLAGAKQLRQATREANHASEPHTWSEYRLGDVGGSVSMKNAKNIAALTNGSRYISATRTGSKNATRVKMET